MHNETAAKAVHAAKYLAQLGCRIKRFKAHGRTAYVTAQWGTERFTVRISDHHPLGGRKKSNGKGHRLISFKNTASTQFLRLMLRRRLSTFTITT